MAGLGIEDAATGGISNCVLGDSWGFIGIAGGLVGNGPLIGFGGIGGGGVTFGIIGVAKELLFC